MKELVEKLRASKTITLGDKADVRRNIDARKYLAEEGRAVFPDEFFSLVKYVNGIRGEGAELFGIVPQSCFSDAVEANEMLDRDDYATVAVLGRTDFDYVVYDTTKEQYQLRDRRDNTLVSSFSSLPLLVKYLFKL